MKHFSYLTDYLHLIATKLDFYVGIGAGVVFLIFSYFAALDEGTVLSATVAIIGLSLLFSGYGVYREERQTRERLDTQIRITATVGSLSANAPDEGRDKTSLKVHVIWEMWLMRDIWTERLGLNVIYVYDKPKWQFWKQTRFPETGRPPDGQDTTQFRKSFRAMDPQPVRQQSVFEYITDRETGDDPHWLLELVLVTGVPEAEFRIPVFIDYDEIQRRGTYPPL